MVQITFDKLQNRDRCHAITIDNKFVGKLILDCLDLSFSIYIELPFNKTIIIAERFVSIDDAKTYLVENLTELNEHYFSKI